MLLCSLILIFLFSVENGGGSGKRWDDLMARRKESVLGSLRGSDQCLWLEDWTDAEGREGKQVANEQMSTGMSNCILERTICMVSLG